MTASRSPCSRSPRRPPCCCSPRARPTCCCSRSASAAGSTPPTSIAQPACSVVTPIGRDHAEYLGDTVESVATEKAGIFKRGCPGGDRARRTTPRPTPCCAAAPRRSGPARSWSATRISPSTRSAVASSTRTRPICSTCRVPSSPAATSWSTPGRRSRRCAPPASATSASRRWRAGLTDVDWPGRLQRLGRGRLAAQLDPGAELWLDGGHNVDGGRILAAAMADLGETQRRAAGARRRSARHQGRRRLPAQLRRSRPRARRRPDRRTRWRRAPPRRSPAIGESVGLSTYAAPSVEAALALVKDIAFERPPRILICGSLYLAGLVLAANDTPPV